ncbi:MAG: alkene reductase [Longimicrobiales bacterium]
MPTDDLLLLQPTRLGPLSLSNRIVMAPMTRNRADRRGVPTAMMATYYEQRASAGLIVSEAVQVSAQGQGYPFTPGLHTDAQVDAWRAVTDAVHRSGGLIFAQLFHGGRISHPAVTGDHPVAPSAIAAGGEVHTYDGMKAFIEPRALVTDEVGDVVQQFARAAANARRAGFDGVELHAANGYLIDQFLRDGTNRRTDRYGGSQAARRTFLLEVVEAVAEEVGPERVGVRLSPANPFNSMSDQDPRGTFEGAAAALAGRGLAYLHVVEGGGESGVDYGRMAAAFGGTYIANGSYDRDRGETALREGAAHLVAYGRSFLANPDLPLRFAEDAPLNDADASTFYQGGAEGYVDYPTLEEVGAGI